MKKIFIYPILFACFASFGQLTLKRADKYFASYDFEKAAYFYKSFLHEKDDAYSQLQLAKIYSYTNNHVEAERWYREVMDRNDLEPVHYLHYAQSLSALGKYQEALPYYDKYRERADDKLLAEEKYYGITHIDEFFADSALAVVKKLDFNSVESDFAPSIYGEDLVFASARGNSFGIQRKFSWNNKNYLDLFQLNKEGEVVKFDKTINSKYHEGAITFSPDGNTAFFTRNNFNKGQFSRSKKGVNMIKLYTATKDANGKWGNIQEFKYNSDEYSTGDPSLSADGLTLYFVSDKPGGFGGTDIYSSKKVGEEWSEPVNLGHKVNTEANERTPFVSKEGNLYFASEGHFGLGGLDLYAADFANGTYVEVRNLGYPVNSSGDDFAMIIDSETRNGYFSSNRAGGKGEDDIYGLYLEEKPAIKIKGNTFWRTDEEDVYSRKGLEDVKISIVNLTSGAFENLYSDENGSFELALKPGSKYEITASKENLITSVASIDLKNSQIKRINPIEMVLVKLLPKPTEVILEGKLIDAKTNKGLANTNFYLLNSTTKKVQKVTTDAEGKYNLKLDPSTNYSLKAAPAGYLVNCTSFSTPVADKDPYTTASPLKLEKLELNKKIEVENLYYDVNQFNIRPDAAVELDKVVQFMNDNSNITIELGAHTDSRGSASANTDLSAKRAKAARDYIVSKGISDKNITFKGYGESQLLNKCKDGVKCEDDLHADNRRTEIKITGIKKDVNSVVTIDESNAFNLDNETNCNNIQIIKK